MNLGEWLGAIPNAIGKFMYDAGIPDPMADQYAKKTQYDLMRRKNEEIIKRQQLDNAATEILAGILPKPDKNGQMKFADGIIGKAQQELANGVPYEQVFQRYGAGIGAVGNITPDKIQQTMLAPQEALTAARMKYGLQMDAKEQAAHRLKTAEFQHRALLQNAKDVMTVIDKVKDTGADPAQAESLTKNFMWALKLAGFDNNAIKEIMVPIYDVANSRKDIDLNRKLYETEQRLAQGWARVNIAASRGSGSGRNGKKIDPSKISLNPTRMEKFEDDKYAKYMSQSAPREADGETPEQFAAKKKEAEDYFQTKYLMEQARLARFREEPEYVLEMRDAAYDDDKIDKILKQRKAQTSAMGEWNFN